MASFTDGNRQHVGLLRSDPAIESLLFPVLYPYGRGHWVPRNTLPVDKLIEASFVRADIPDPELEPRLHELVMKFQIHSCREDLCGGPQAPTGQCRKGFPAPLSPITHLEQGSLRFNDKTGRAQCIYFWTRSREILLHGFDFDLRFGGRQMNEGNMIKDTLILYHGFWTFASV